MFSHTAHTISSQFEIIALAGIGMRVKFRDLVKDGPKALLYGGTVGICQVGIAIGLIFIFFDYFKKAPENSGAFFMLQT